VPVAVALPKPLSQCVRILDFVGRRAPAKKSFPDVDGQRWFIGVVSQRRGRSSRGFNSSGSLAMLAAMSSASSLVTT
jgi:hypothetical protein